MSKKFQIPRVAFASLVIGTAACGGSEGTADKVAKVSNKQCSILICEGSVASADRASCETTFKSALNSLVSSLKTDGAPTACIDAYLDYYACESDLELKACQNVAANSSACDSLYDRYAALCP